MVQDISKKCIILGPFSVQKASTGFPTAANIWIENLLRLISEEYSEIVVISYEPMSAKTIKLKRGIQFTKTSKNIKYIEVSYFNLYGFRKFSVCISYIKELKKIFLSGDSKLDLFIYNPTLTNLMTVYYLKFWIGDFRLFNIVLDLNYFATKLFSCLELITPKESYNIFASHYLYLRSKKSRKIYWFGSKYLDVALESEREMSKDRILFVYSGKSGNYSNLENVIRAFDELNSEKLKLIITGDVTQRLREIVVSSGIIEFLGFVSFDDLYSLSLKADYFISCQKIDHYSAFINFPSKILYYVGFLKPIISDAIPSVSEDIREKLIIVNDSEVNSWKSVLLNIKENNSTFAFTYSVKTVALSKYLDSEIQGQRLKSFIYG